ncbi:MAG: hypothetical protein EZS28_009075 [Streblomastix strix]|uniref:Uncharacterized protein n=1 Tax=Streblomastix strix TaxID=222440 RepID=A0A5J4WK24_9EUKA|nr:MAG: hypothetical protein EZS28_009075 [Streblomastix strix]
MRIGFDFSTQIQETATLTTDVSRTGWGALLKLYQSELQQASTWKKPMSLRSSNQREARAILYALRKFKLQLAGIDQLTVQTDNQVAVMNLQCKASAALLATTMRLIFQEATQMGLMLHAVHIMGVDNKQTDALSRPQLAGVCQIRTKYLTIALLQLGLTLQEDMFATKINAKCTIYYFPTQEYAAAGTGGLQAVWQNKTILINPTLPLVCKIVHKHRIISNCTVVMIAMDWPNQKLSQQLQIMASDKIILDNSDQIFKDDYSMKQEKMKQDTRRVILYVIRTGEEIQSSTNQLLQNIYKQKIKNL